MVERRKVRISMSMDEPDLSPMLAHAIQKALDSKFDLSIEEVYCVEEEAKQADASLYFLLPVDRQPFIEAVERCLRQLPIFKLGIPREQGRAVMPVTSTEIASYSANCISYEDPNKFAATLTLFDASGKALAFWGFYLDASQAAANEFRDDLGYPLLSAPAASLPSIMDVLRDEKPVYFTFYDYRPVRLFGAIGTAREPVGLAETR